MIRIRALFSLRSSFTLIGRGYGGFTFVIHILLPLSIQPPSVGLAEVFMLTTSEPAETSDIASAPIFSPDIKPGRYRAFCAEEPFRVRLLIHN